MSFDPTTLVGEDLVWWRRWKSGAETQRAACIAAIGAGGVYTFADNVWSELKGFLFKHAFRGRCGYCESPTTHVTYGDADHFRPKNRVTVKVNGRVQDASCKGSRRHPGYYWLAYDWENLVPACERCNRANGKMNQFPVRGDHSCDPRLDSAALDALEQPLLLNPYHESSEGVLRFGERGTVTAIDGNSRGQHSIDTYWLDREDLETERSREQERAWGRYLAGLEYGGAEKGNTELARWASGSEPFSSAAIDYVLLMWESCRPRLSGGRNG